MADDQINSTPNSSFLEVNYDGMVIVNFLINPSGKYTATSCDSDDNVFYKDGEEIAFIFDNVIIIAKDNNIISNTLFSSSLRKGMIIYSCDDRKHFKQLFSERKNIKSFSDFLAYLV